MINDPRAKNKRLVELCDDPLAAARAQARGAKEEAFDPDAKGRQCVLAKILEICIIVTCSKCTRRLTFYNSPQGFRDDDEENEDRKTSRRC